VLGLPGYGPEDVVVDGRGRLLTGVEDGRILRVDPGREAVEVVGDTRGRPLGLEMLPDDSVLICDSHRGLLRLDPDTGAVAVLVEHVGGQPLRFCSNAVAAPDGTVYFTESTSRYRFEHWRAAIDGDVDVLLGGLQFANGVVLAPDGASLVVAETGGYRLTRFRLEGPQAGRSEVLRDNLPGFPDNLSLGVDGSIWVAMANPRNPLLDWLHGKPPLLRRLLWSLPERLQPDVAPTVWVMAVSFDGDIVRDLQARDARYGMVTGVVEHDGRLYLASIRQRGLAVLDLGGR
jgi:sugar lactone lactonase YvrE